MALPPAVVGGDNYHIFWYGPRASTPRPIDALGSRAASSMLGSSPTFACYPIADGGESLLIVGDALFDPAPASIIHRREVL
jgi:hypothetical protein